MRRGGFTLVELVLVLAILSLLSLLAVRQLSHGAATLRRERSDAQLEAVAQAIRGDAVLKDGMVRDAARAVVGSSFVSDLGRPPRALREELPGGPQLTLRELLSPSADMFVYGSYAASNSLSEATLRRCGRIAADRGVAVLAGWNGPYLDGASPLADGWGNPLAAEEGEFCAADGLVYATVLGEDFAGWRESQGTRPAPGSVMSNGFAVAFVRHLGADQLEDVNAARLYAVTNSPEGRLNADRVADLRAVWTTQLTVRVSVPDTFAPDRCGFRLYAPEPHPTAADVRAHRALTAYQVTSERFVPEFRVAFPPGTLAVGRRVLRAWACQGAVTNFSAPRIVYLKAGADSLPAGDAPLAIDWPEPDPGYAYEYR